MHLLLVANFAADAGYAWDTIEAVLRAVGERLVDDGHRVTVAYAEMPEGPSQRMRGAPFDFITFDYNRVYSAAGLRDFLRLLRQRHIDTLYLTDRETWSPRYLLYRRAGVRRIIVHDRTSGKRSVRARPIRALKRMLHQAGPIAADTFIGVSRFVQQRLIECNGTPAAATCLVYNGIDFDRFNATATMDLHSLAGLHESTPIVFCSGRVAEYKGFQTVVEAASILRQQSDRDIAFVVCGDGPYLPELKELAHARGCTNVHFPGRRSDIPQLLRTASIAVVPSLWEEAFGLTVVEAMIAGVPLIATRVGGIPELIEHEATGLLIDPGQTDALVRGINRLLNDPAAAAAMAEAAAAAARKRFSLDRVAAELYAVVTATALDTVPEEVESGLRRTHATLLMNSSRSTGRY